MSFLRPHDTLLIRRRIEFTLVELLVVIAIVSILASILLPALKNAKSSASTIACVNNLKQAALGAHAYAADFNGYAPWPGKADPGKEPTATNMTNFYLQWYLGNPKYTWGPLLVDAGYWNAAALQCPSRPMDAGNNAMLHWDTSIYTTDGSQPGNPANTVISSSYFFKTTSDKNVDNYWTIQPESAPGRWGWRLGRYPAGMLLCDVYWDSTLKVWRNSHQHKMVRVFEDGAAGTEPYHHPIALSNRNTTDGYFDLFKLRRDRESRPWQ